MRKLVGFCLFLMCLLPLPSFAGQTLSAETVVDTAKSALEQQFLGKDYEWILRSRIKDQTIPDGHFRLQVGTIKNKSTGGNIIIPVHVFFQERKYRSFSVAFSVKVYRTVLVTKNVLRQGELVDANNLQLQRCDISSLDGSPCTSFDEVTASRAVRYLGRGSILTKEMMESLPLVHRNQLVTVRIIGDGITIEISGKALQDGYLGERVEIRNLENKKQLSGYVVDSNLVEIRE